MIDKHRPISCIPTTVTPANYVLAAQWFILACLFLVFAKDFNSWADSHPQPLLGAAAQPVAHSVLFVAQLTGVTAGRDYIESLVHPVYDSPLVIGAVTPVVAAGMAESNAPEPPAQVGAMAPNSSALSKSAPQRVLIVGASSIQEELGIALEHAIEQYQGIETMRLGKISSGLARPDYYDWNSKIKELLADFKPDLVVAQWGGNDCQSLSDASGKVVANYDTPAWDAEYTRRIEAMVELIHSNNANVVLIGMPYMKSRNFSHRIERLNHLTQAAAEKSGAVYLPMWDMTRDSNGNLRTSIKIDGKQRMMRLSDGIHFSEAGASLVAAELCAQLEKYYFLTRQN